MKCERCGTELRRVGDPQARRHMTPEQEALLRRCPTTYAAGEAVNAALAELDALRADVHIEHQVALGLESRAKDAEAERDALKADLAEARAEIAKLRGAT